MPSAPSRFEVEHLHRLMIQASVEAARLDGRLGEAQTADGLGPLLRHWHEAAGALDQAVARARGPLEQEGTPKDQIDRIRRRLAFLQEKSKQIDLEVDLDECVQSWNGIGLELAQLSGKQREVLVRLLQDRKPAIDRATAMLSEALRHEGLLQEDLRKRTRLREERDRARDRHERLRQAWLAAQRDWEAAQRQRVPDPGAQQHEVKRPPVPDLRRGSQHGTSPAIVRLPLNRLLECGHHRAGAVAARVEKTLSHLATAEHRTLTDPTAGELRAHLARMDSVLARLSGQRGDELRDGAREVSTLLHRMSAIATRAGASAHVAPFRKLMEERKGQLRRLAQDSGGQPRRAALWPPPHVRDPGHPLRELRGSNPGLDRLLRQSSQAQLAAELSKQSRAGLHSIPATPVPRAAGFAAATLAGLGGAHPTGLGALAGGGGALANALATDLGQPPRREEPTGEIPAGLHPAPERTALRELARRAELREQLATRSLRKGPPPSQITGAELLDAAREHPKGRAFAAHLAPGGPLRALCETVQRGHGLAIGQAAQHYLASRGGSQLWNAVATFNALAKEGYTPRFSLGSWLRKNVSDPGSHALRSLSGTEDQGALAAASLGAGAREGISSLGQRARGGARDAFEPGAFHALKKLKTFPRTRPRNEAGGLEAIARGRELMTKGRRVAQGAHDKLGKVHQVVERGLAGAGRVQSGLEKAIELARQGAGIFGEDSDLGRALTHAADRADQIHDHLEIGIDAAQRFNQKVGATHDLLEKIPGGEEKGEQEAPAYLEGGRRKRSPHGQAEPPEAQVAPAQETEEQRAARLRRAWERIGSVSSQVQRFEQESAKAQLRIQELLREGKANGASTELMGLGSRCEQIDRAIREAKTLSRGEEKYEKQVGFYEDWHRRTREKLHARIADTQGLGSQVAISGFGIQESTHRDIFENTRAIYAVRTKVQSFAGALHDRDASEQVGKVLAEARKAKSELQALKTKYRKDKAAHEFLTGGGSQDKLIDEVLQKLAGAEKAATPKERKVAGVAEQMSEMLGENSALGQLAQQLSEGAGKEHGHHAKEIGKGASREVQEASHEGWDLTAQDVQVVFESVNGLHARRPQPRGADRDAPPRIETDGEPTLPVVAHDDRTQHDPFSDLLDDMFAGGDARIHVDRSGARLDLDELDLQDVDPAAMDTWIGSGEAVKLFSEVFGAFIPAEAAIVVHAGRGGGHARGKASEPGEPTRQRRKQRGGFFARLFDQLEGFADRIGGWAKKGSFLLGKGMHFAELGMHGLSRIEGAAERVQGFAGKSEGFLERMGLRRLAGYAGRMGAATDGVDEEAKLLHDGLKTADQWMGRSKKATGVVEQGAHAAAGIFDHAAQGRPGALVNIFKASRNGDGIDGKLSPDRVPLGSVFDEPRRLDLSTLSRMGSFLGGDFSGVRIHTGPGAAEVTRRFNAEAVTVKDHIFFAPGRFNPVTVEGQKLIAHELTHVLQKGRANLDVRTAEGEALHSEHSYGRGPSMETLNLRRPQPGFRIAADGEGMGASSGIHTAKRTRSRGDETGSKDTLPDGEELLEQVSGRVYELLMEELEQGFQSR